MAKNSDESRADREHLRDALRRRGHNSVDHIAQAIRERWHHGHMRSYRLALELSQPQVCDQVNALQDANLGETGYLDPSILSKFERWPAYGRRPSAGYLIALAHVYNTSARNLIADTDWDTFPPLDRHTLTTLDQATAVGAVAHAATTGMMDPGRPQAGTGHRLPTPWAGFDLGRPGTPSGRDVLMTGEESAQYAEQGSNIGGMTLDQLRADTSEQAGKFANADHVDVFRGTRQLRDRIFTYLDGGQPIRQRRDLYFLAGAACGLLAGASDNLGYPTAAMSHARAGHVFAMEAGDPALTGWLYAMQAMICYWNAQPGKARDYARRGAASHPAGTVGVWLPAVEARASGELGDTAGTRDAINRATEARELVQPTNLDEFGGLMYYNQAKQHFYAADAYLGLGDDPAVVTEATLAMNSYANGPAKEFNYTDMVIIRLHSAVAHVRAGDLDAAGESAQAALELGTEHRNAHVDTSARRLHRHLRAAGMRESQLAVDTRDQIEDFLSVTPARLELS